MKRLLLAAAMAATWVPATAAPLSTNECASMAAQVDGRVAAPDLDVSKLIQDGDPQVAEAARRFQALRQASPSNAALVNATGDLRYQLEVCARR